MKTTQNTVKTTHRSGNGKSYCIMDGCKLLKGVKNKTAVQ
jgi:hypothetical protein